MLTPARRLAICGWLLILNACMSRPSSTATVIPPVGASLPATTSISANLEPAQSLVLRLKKQGLVVSSVRESTEGSMFQSATQAASIVTDQGVVNIVFFLNPDEAQNIQVTSLPSQEAGRYLYRIQAPSPTMLHAVTMDADHPVYFIVRPGLLMITDSVALHQILLKIWASP